MIIYIVNLWINIIKKKLTEEEVKFLQQIKKELNEKQRENNEISNT